MLICFVCSGLNRDNFITPQTLVFNENYFEDNKESFLALFIVKSVLSLTLYCYFDNISILIDIFMKMNNCPNKRLVGKFPEFAKLFRVLSESNRLKILCLLEKGELCVCDIWQNIGLSQNLASNHLRILYNLKLITSRRAGQKIYYAINRSVFKKYNLLLNNFLKKYE